MLKDKVILVTGASRGIGKAVALMAAKNHARVILNYNGTDAEPVVKEILAMNGYAWKVKADVSKEEEVKEMFVQIKEKEGRLDVLVNNAGIMKGGLMLMTPIKDIDDTLNINVKGVYFCMQRAAKMMMKQKSGKIINIASLKGELGEKGLVIYSASKAAVIGMTKAASKELGPMGITVNAVAPGFIETDLTKNTNEDDKKNTLNRMVIQRLGTPVEVAQAVLFLAESDYITGAVIDVNGGVN